MDATPVSFADAAMESFAGRPAVFAAASVTQPSVLGAGGADHDHWNDNDHHHDDDDHDHDREQCDPPHPAPPAPEAPPALTQSFAEASAHLPPLESGNVFLSVIEDGPILSFCAYSEEENALLVETARVNGYEVTDLVERVLSSVRPTLLLLPNKIVSNHDFLTLLTTKSQQHADFLGAVGAADDDERDADSGDDGVPGHSASGPRSTPYRIIKSASLDARACRVVIMKLRVRSIERKHCSPNAVASQQHPHPPPYPVIQGQRLHLNPQPQRLPRNFPIAPRPPGYEVSHYHALASVVDFDCKAQVQAVGSLLSFLQTTIFQHAEGGIVVVNDVRELRTSSFMKIHPDAMASLHIFRTEHHPLGMAKGTRAGNAKEGCSLFSLLDRTRTHAGRLRLREWMLKPLLSAEDIQRRQDGVELFLRPEFQPATSKLSELLRHVGGVSKILTRIQKSSTRHNDFVALPRAIAYAMSVCEVMERDFRYPLRRRLELSRRWRQQRQQDPKEPPAPQEKDPNNKPVTRDDDTASPTEPGQREGGEDEDSNVEYYLEFLEWVLGRCHVQVMEQVIGHMASIVDEEATAGSDHMVVVQGYSEELDDYKNKYENLGGIMLVYEKDLITRVPWLRQSVKVLFFPQVGFLAVIRNYENWINDFSLPDDFEIVFTEMNVYYFKCLEVFELDHEFGDLNAKIRDMENLIAGDLEDAILECDGDLRETFDALANLDCILSFADVAAELGLVRPSIVPEEEKCILIRHGRHPLQELLLEEGKQFVRNDVAIDSVNRVNVVTGPNFSGKSCYARQVGILSYMAQLGSFLPCQGARISIVDQILSQFSTVETCAVPQSSFQLDLTRMSSIMRLATPSSLVLIDEFGKGTSPASGIGLLAATLQKLSQVGSMVVCTTHFLEMFSMGVLNDGSSGIRALQMEVQIPENDREDAMPLFRLRAGVAKSSAGLTCAKISGVKQSVLERALEIVQTIKGERRIDPLMEVLRNQLPDHERETVAKFVCTDWNDADEETVQDFREQIESL